MNVKPPRRTPLTRRVARYLDDRVGAAGAVRKVLDKVFPDHWSFYLGEVSLWSFVVLLLTGVYLSFFYDPSLNEVAYDGSYEAFRGVEMTRAYASVLDLSFDVRAGLVMRQIHHWGALVFIAVTTVHLARVFFTGAFRRPREVNWAIGVTLLLLSIVEGFAGYSLADDQLSGTGLRIAYNIAISVPLVGTWVASFLFGGEFPGPDIIARLYVAHILLLPVALGTLIGAHLFLLVRQRHTHFAGPGRTEANVVGERLWPTFMAKGLGMFFLTGALLSALGGLFQINPIWIYGPYKPADVSAASQPDWYMGWLDGALRLMPSFEVRAFGFEIPNPFFPAVVLPGITFALLYLWPYLEKRFTKDTAEHHLLDRPRDRPLRTALGVSTLTFYTVLFAGSATDVLAISFQSSLNALLLANQIALFVLPPLFGFVAHRLCKELALRDVARRTRAATVGGAPSPGDGTGHQREIAPEGAHEREGPATTADVARR